MQTSINMYVLQMSLLYTCIDVTYTVNVTKAVLAHSQRAGMVGQAIEVACPTMPALCE
jgi:hypothetical protein